MLQKSLTHTYTKVWFDKQTGLLQQFQGANNGPSNKESQFSAILIRKTIMIAIDDDGINSLWDISKSSIKSYIRRS